jgi:hypothetical protein
MHNISNVKAVNPVICISRSNAHLVSCANLKALILLESVHFIECLKGYFEVFLVRSSICKVLRPLFSIHIPYIYELLL